MDNVLCQAPSVCLGPVGEAEHAAAVVSAHRGTLNELPVQVKTPVVGVFAPAAKIVGAKLVFADDAGIEQEQVGVADVRSHSLAYRAEERLLEEANRGLSVS